MLKDCILRPVNMVIEVLREWKINMLLDSLRTSYELRKRIFTIRREEDKKHIFSNRQKIIIDLTPKEYNFLKKININFFDLVESFCKSRQESFTVFGTWEYVEYKPIEGYEKEKRLVYRYYIYFDFDEKLESKCI